MMKVFLKIMLVVCLCAFTLSTIAAEKMVFKAGHKTLQVWLMPKSVPYPEGNKPTKSRVDLGKKLFFDPRLSGDGNMSCGSCHSPMFGWSDGLPTARGFRSVQLERATPTIVNSAFNSLQMWDGREKSLESQALGPMVSAAEMNVDLTAALDFLKGNGEYVHEFEKAYPGEGVTDVTLAKALASYERTVISNNSSFDKWVKGNRKAMTKQQIRGFKLFVDPNKGNCEVCHSAPNFTDNGFHNIGLPSFAEENPDMGRYSIKPVGILKGAFKTPTLRDVELTAPYFHDGSAASLMAVVDHYVTGGVDSAHGRVDPNMKALELNESEKSDLVAFMEALTSPQKPVEFPSLPKN